MKALFFIGWMFILIGYLIVIIFSNEKIVKFATYSVKLGVIIEIITMAIHVINKI